jgi:hypothetical protein
VKAIAFEERTSRLVEGEATEGSVPRLSIDAYAVAAILAGLIYCLTLLFFTDRSWLGNADDGIYLYTARRVAQGVCLYREIFAAPPPLMLFWGALLLKLHNSLFTIRVYSILLQLLIALITWRISLRLFAQRRAAFLAVVIYLLLPIGFEYDRMFVLDPLVLLFSLLGAVALMEMRPRKCAAAGLWSVLAVFTKLTYLPTLALNVAYLAVRQRRLLIPYLLPFGLACAVITAALWAYSGPSFLSDLATQRLLGASSLYFLFGNLQIILNREGMFLALACVGLLLFFRECEQEGPRYFMWYSLLAFCSFMFMSRKGTYWHFFVGAEPSVALFSGYLVSRALEPLATKIKSASLWQPGLVTLFLFGVLFIPALVKDVCGVIYHFSDAEARAITAQIERHSASGQPIFAYPYYAFLADRPIVSEYADIFMWHERYMMGDPQAIALVDQIAADLEAGGIPVVAISDLMDLPPIRAALAQRYHLLGTVRVGENIRIYIPR